MSESRPPDSSSKKPGPAGRVRHDASGRAVWEWAIDTGKHAIDSTSRLLKRLELPGLALEEDAKKKKSEPPAETGVPTFGGKPEVDPKAGNRTSFNPYDNRSPPKRAAASPAAAKTSSRPAAANTAPKKTGLLARLFGKR